MGREPQVIKTTRRGRMSHKDMEYIRSHAGTMSAEAIGDVIKKTPEMVQQYIDSWLPPSKVKEEVSVDEEERWTIKKELRSSQMWKNLAKEFDSDEMLFFEETYIKLMSQFRGDVLATEESDIFHVAKYEILMHRNLAERKRGQTDKDRLEKKQRDLFMSVKSVHDLDEDQMKIVDAVEKQISSLEAGLASKTNEYVKLQKCRDDLLTRLKATRGQRIKEIESSKISFLGLIKELQSKDLQEREGREAALMKLAGEREYDRLGHALQYEDGNWDNPILSADTVDFGPLEDKQDFPIKPPEEI